MKAIQKKLIREISIWIDEHSGKTPKELRGKVMFDIVMPYKFLMFLSRIKLKRVSKRIIGKWMAFDLYPEYEQDADDIVEFIQETLEESLNVFETEEDS